ncbi:MAG: hypothetical protein H7Y11_05145 [Armatimonadetes bacterium]|nr:hypothetical protein [Anaerolineae bacterium]
MMTNLRAQAASLTNQPYVVVTAEDTILFFDDAPQLPTYSNFEAYWQVTYDAR